MADPLSITGSAVGVVSLGLTVCQSLIKYYDALKNGRSNVEAVTHRVRELERIFSVLNAVLPKLDSSHQSAAAEVRRCVLSCREGIAELKSLLTKCRQDSQSLHSVKDKLRAQGQNLLYPFRQDTLQRLTNIVSELRMNLDTALSILQLDIGATQAGKLISLTTISSSTASELTDVKNDVHAVDLKLQTMDGALPVIQSDTSSILALASGIDRRLDDTHQILGNVQSIESSYITALDAHGQQLVDVKQSQYRTEEMIQDVNTILKNLQLSLISRPAMLRAAIDEAGPAQVSSYLSDEAISEESFYKGANHAHRKRPRPSCNCRLRKQDSGLSYSNQKFTMFLSRAKTEIHDVNCPFYFGSQSAVKFGVQYICSTFLLARAIKATMSIKTGAGGFSISPRLRTYSVVPEDAPTFELFSPQRFGKYEYKNDIDAVCALLENTMQQVFQVFRDRKGSPNDIVVSPESYVDGTNLLHAACEAYQHLGQSVYHPTVSSAYRRLLRNLVAAGVSLDHTDRRGWTPLDTLIYHGDYSIPSSSEHFAEVAMIALDLNDYGVVPSSFDISERWVDMRWLQWFEDLREDWQCGRLSQAILDKCEREVEHILAEHPASIFEKNVQQKSPLHLSSDWPQGVALLLNSGAAATINDPDSDGHLPLHYACASGNVTAARLMIDADSAMYPGYHGSLSIALRVGSTELTDSVINALINRRKRLQDLAVAHLPRSILIDLQVSESKVVDAQAYKLVKTLETNGVPIADSLTVLNKTTTVFHLTKILTVEMAERLYQAGFHDIDEENRYGKTPLSTVSFGSGATANAVQLANWFISKGASLDRKLTQLNRSRGIDQNSASAHSVAKNLQYAINSSISNHHATDLATAVVTSSALDEFSPFVFRIFKHRIYDDCLCGCTESGCSPATTMLTRARDLYGWLDRDQASAALTIMRRHLLSLMEPHFPADQENHHRLVREVLRVETFIRMGLRHTCCELYESRFLERPDQWKEEAGEIRHEERFLLEQLEELLIEFEGKYHEVGLPVTEFLDGYWAARMAQVLDESQPVDENDMRRIEEVGVILR